MDRLRTKIGYLNLATMLEAYQAAVNEAAIVSITDLDGTIAYVNKKFVEISKYSYEELVGQNHRIINSGHHSSKFFKLMWKTISSGKVWRGEIKNKTKDGNFYWVDTVITPVFDQHGNLIQYFSIRNLITLQKEQEENLIKFQKTLLKREQQLKDAQVVSVTGSWYLDLPGETLEWSEETYRIFDIPFETAMTYNLFLQLVHPEDRQMVNENWLAALKTGKYDIEHRIVVPGHEKWVREQAHFEFDESGTLLRALGTVQDITEKKQNENILAQSELLYRNLFNNSPFAIGILSKDSLQFLQVNETAVKLYGYTSNEFLQLNAYDIRVKEQHNNLEAQIREDSYTKDNSVRAHRKKDGSIIYVEPAIAEINYRGKQAYLITIHDITEKLRMEEELRQIKIGRENELLRATMESQENSRAEIGRELHDNINQLLVASTIFLKHALFNKSDDKILISKSLDIVVSAMDEIRKLSSSFVPPSLNVLTLKEAIGVLAQNFQLSNTTIAFDIRINEAVIDEAFKINIYRIIQEQCNNIIKHAAATTAIISLVQSENKLLLKITDNGKGFDPKQKAKGIGLSNIIHRTEAYYGKLNIQSKPGKGCSITATFTLPLH